MDLRCRSEENDIEENPVLRLEKNDSSVQGKANLRD